MCLAGHSGLASWWRDLRDSPASYAQWLYELCSLYVQVDGRWR